jgi:ubiquinone/menaquinone biosynthesis C-methylase UbiE
MVYAQDVQFEMLNAISRRVQREGLTNVQPVLGQGNNPNFPPRAKGKLDAILMAGVYHEIDDPVTLLKNLAAAVQPQGRIGIVDFKAQGGGPGPSPEERVDPQVVIADAGSAGLRLVSHETFLPYQYLLIFTRAADPTTSKRPEARR